uniref:Uncharacterized protein n=1 Tax=Medicago truncatula TaxID=3880 RepID=B7FI81_MEDTR|nr:unknown [Medicago truncatula]
MTSKIDAIPSWTIDGILEHVQSESKKQQDESLNAKKITGLWMLLFLKSKISLRCHLKPKREQQNQNQEGMRLLKGMTIIRL